MVTLNCLYLSLQLFPSDFSYQKEAVCSPTRAGVEASSAWASPKLCSGSVALPHLPLQSSCYPDICFLYCVLCSVLSCRDLGKICDRRKADSYGLLASLSFMRLFSCAFYKTKKKRKKKRKAAVVICYYNWLSWTRRLILGLSASRENQTIFIFFFFSFPFLLPVLCYWGGARIL